MTGRAGFALNAARPAELTNTPDWLGPHVGGVPAEPIGRARRASLAAVVPRVPLEANWLAALVEREVAGPFVTAGDHGPFDTLAPKDVVADRAQPPTRRGLVVCRLNLRRTGIRSARRPESGASLSDEGAVRGKEAEPRVPMPGRSGHPRSGHYHPQQDGVHPEAEHKLGLEEQDQQDRRRDGRHRDDRLPPT